MPEWLRSLGSFQPEPKKKKKKPEKPEPEEVKAKSSIPKFKPIAPEGKRVAEVKNLLETPPKCLIPELKSWQRRTAQYFYNNQDSPRQKGLLSIDPYGSGKTFGDLAAAECFLEVPENKGKQVLVITTKSNIPHFKEILRKYFKRKDMSPYVFTTSEGFTRFFKDGKVWRQGKNIFDCQGNMIVIDESHKFRTTIPPKELSTLLETKQMPLKKKSQAKGAQAMLLCSALAKRVLESSATPMFNKTTDLANQLAYIGNEIDEHGIDSRKVLSPDELEVSRIEREPELWKQMLACKIEDLTPDEHAQLARLRPDVKREIEVVNMSPEHYKAYQAIERSKIAAAYKPLKDKRGSFIDKVKKILAPKDAFHSKKRRGANNPEYTLSFDKLYALMEKYADNKDVDLWLRKHADLVPDEKEINTAEQKAQQIVHKEEIALPEQKMTFPDLVGFMNVYKGFPSVRQWLESYAHLVDHTPQFEKEAKATDEAHELMKKPALRELAKEEQEAIIQANSKLRLIIKDVLDHPDDRFFIFSNFRGHGIEMVAKALESKGVKVGLVTGDTTDRAKVMKDYNTRKTRVFLGSPAAREGINLKNTKKVIELDRGWNEANTEQFLYRAIRLDSHPWVEGQKKPVVHVLQFRLVKPENWKALDEEIRANDRETDKLLKELVTQAQEELKTTRDDDEKAMLKYFIDLVRDPLQHGHEGSEHPVIEQVLETGATSKQKDIDWLLKFIREGQLYNPETCHV